MNEHDIFLAALEIDDPVARAAYLEQACSESDSLRQQVESLLASHARSGEFLNVPALQQIGAAAVATEPTTSETIVDHDRLKQSVELPFLQTSTQADSLGRLGHYEVREVIGQGGCGIVLKAFDESLHRMVAIKVMTPELAATSPARKRFLREARAAAAIRHENVVSIYSVDDQPIPFLVMEYIAGQTLQQRLDQTGPFDVTDVVQIGIQIAHGLEAAHAIGLIHRDIKPGNILLEQGRNRIKITDFGLARAADDASITQSGVIAGTPLYMSPEQAQGLAIDHRSDLFSLGSVLYVMCSGRPPFRAATTMAVLKRVTEDNPRPIKEIIPEVPDWLIAIITRLLSKNPADRFGSAQEVADVLTRYQAEWQQGVRIESPPLGDVITPASVPHAAPPRSPVISLRQVSMIAALVLLSFAGLGMTEATGVTNVRGTVIRMLVPDGTLVVEVDDPTVSVSIDGEQLVITGAGANEIRLRPGSHQVEASKAGQVITQELVTIAQNGRQVVRVNKVGPAVAPQAAPAASLVTTPPAFIRGHWQIEDGVLEQTEPGQQAMLLFGSANLGDGDFECEAMRSTGDHGLALVARASDLENYYYFDVGVFGNKFTSIYAKESKGDWRRLDQKPTAPVPTDRWVKLKLRLRGNSFEGYLDDQLVVIGHDDVRRQGYIGLRTWNETGKYRNLKFTDPSGKVLWEGLPKLPPQ